MSRWSSNNEEPMSHYLNNSCYRALWKYPDCGGEYISSIRDMATGNVDCVYCSMKEVLPGVNSFAVLHPDLMNEWNHLDNYLLCDPDQILDNCITPVCWTCPVCAHDYKCSPKQRILYQKRNMDACTFCKGLRRKERHYIWLREGHFISLKMGKVTFLYYLLFKGNHVLETIIKYNLKIFILYTVLLFTWQIWILNFILAKYYFHFTRK